ncbi:MAG: hypothetical protein WDO24_19390 [Pseudomonadota bacterium]
MTVRGFFFACLAAAAGVALLAALVTVGAEWRQFAAAGQARRAAVAIGGSLEAAEALTLEAAAYNQQLQADSAADAATGTALARDRATSDAALAGAIARIAETDLPDAAAQADGLRGLVTALGALRRAADQQLALPKARRGFDELQGLLDRFDDGPRQIDRVLEPIERALTALDGAGANAIWMAHRATEMRELAGRRARFYFGAIAVREPLEEEQLERIAELTGRIDQTGLQIRAAIARVGNPPRLAAALETVDQRFYRDAAALHQPLDAAARGGGVYPLSVDQYRAQAPPLIQAVLAIRDAGIGEALDHAAALARRRAVEPAAGAWAGASGGGRDRRGRRLVRAARRQPDRGADSGSVAARRRRARARGAGPRPPRRDWPHGRGDRDAAGQLDQSGGARRRGRRPARGRGATGAPYRADHRQLRPG